MGSDSTRTDFNKTDTLLFLSIHFDVIPWTARCLETFKRRQFEALSAANNGSELEQLFHEPFGDAVLSAVQSHLNSS